MKKLQFKKCLLFFGLLMVSLSSYSQENLPGVFEGHGDVGTNVKPGSVTYIRQTQQYVISGAGYNIWGDHDEFHFFGKR